MNTSAPPIDNVPAELRKLPHWLLWQDEDGNKIPRTKDGDYGRSNDPGTWTTYQTAVRVRRNFTGIAFVFSADDPYCGVDLDQCLDENGMLLEWAIPFVTRFSAVGYGEISPGKRGIKFITRGKKPEGSRCVHVVDADLKRQVEVYDHGRFDATTNGTLVG
jgi:primase-polymerase (primpol)-like protein